MAQGLRRESRQGEIIHTRTRWSAEEITRPLPVWPVLRVFHELLLRIRIVMARAETMATIASGVPTSRS